MRLFFSKHELKLRRKRTIAAIICMVVVLGVYWILTRPQKAAPEMPTVIVEPVVKDDVEIYGEYVGRIRAQQFVEVRARVEGYLENMLFAEGTYVNKNQVLFVISPFILYLLGKMLYGYIRYGRLTLKKFDTVLTFVLIGILLVFGVVRNLPPFDFLRPYG